MEWKQMVSLDFPSSSTNDGAEEPAPHPSHCHTDSFPGFQPWNTETFDVKKKRKLLFEQLSFPTPKLPCWGSIRFSSGDKLKFNRNPRAEEEEEEEEGSNDLINMAIKVKEMPEEKVPMKGEKGSIEDELLQRSYDHEEDLLEFGSHASSSTEQCYGRDSPESLLLLPSDSKNDFVLSSGRWSVDPEAESKTIKPTIDQEFEQYFSMFLP